MLSNVGAAEGSFPHSVETQGKNGRGEGLALDHVYVLREVSKQYGPKGVLANDRISLEIKAGGILGVFGPNGAGKTAMVRQMMGLLRPTSGDIELLGTSIVRHPEFAPAHVAYFSQRIMALRVFTFREILVHTGVHRGLLEAAARKQAANLIDKFDCGYCADRVLYTLSGGEQKLAFVLGAFMADMPVMVLDEPTNDLDPRRRAMAWEHMLERNRANGVTIILVTHNVLEADTIVDRVVIIDRGKIQAAGTPGELKARFGGQARVDLTLKPGVAAPSDLTSRARHVHGQTWSLRAPAPEVGQVFNGLIDTLGLQAIDDFRVLTPTLEDVYVEVTGRAWDEPKHAD